MSVMAENPKTSAGILNIPKESSPIIPDMSEALASGQHFLVFDLERLTLP